LGWKGKDLLLNRSPAAATDPAPNFDPLARPYRWLEYLTFGPFLWRCRIHFLPHLAGCRSALVLGDGDGRFTARLLRDNPQIHIHAVDASPRMIALLQRNAKPDFACLTTEVADLRLWKPAESPRYDLIVTHFFLDCLTTEEITALARSLTPAVAPGGFWLVSEFTIPPTAFGRAVAMPLVAILYRAFRLFTGLRPQSLPGYACALTASGWTIQSQRPHLRGLLLSQLWQRTSQPAESQTSRNPST